MPNFLDKVAGGINKGVATVSANSKAMMEKSQVKTIIKNLETERKQLAELLGMKLYETCTESGETLADESMANFITEIKKRLDGISEQEAALLRIEEELSRVTGAKPAVSGDGVACACGHTAPQGAKFCAKCGNTLV
ncbi:MAG: hypothetical protein FWE08_04015 [Oscillospiraceae bacterium]|nr:hypothetical protein [Oscillospiraceae bacterium]